MCRRDWDWFRVTLKRGGAVRKLLAIVQMKVEGWLLEEKGVDK